MNILFLDEDSSSGYTNRGLQVSHDIGEGVNFTSSEEKKTIKRNI